MPREDNPDTALLRRAEDLARTDPAAAIALLEAAREAANFLPWTGFLLTRLLIQDKRPAAARQLNDQVFAAAPGFVPGWAQRLALARGQPDQASRIEAILAQVRARAAQGKPLSEAWFSKDYLRLLVATAPADHAALTDAGFAGALLDQTLRDGLAAIIPFVAALRDRLGDHAGATTWRFAIFGRQAICRTVGTVVQINLGRLALDGLRGWEMALAEPLVSAIAALMPEKDHADDRGMTSWTSVTREDRWTAIFWRLLQAETVRQYPDRPARPAIALATLKPGALWVRPGNVELWALWNHLVDAEAAGVAAEAVASSTDLAIADEPWWPRLSAERNIARLATNAGWYARPGRGGAAFADWAARYLLALGAGQLLAAHTAEFLRVAAVAPGLRHQVPHQWSDAAFLALLDGADVLLVSAYAQAIAGHHAAGGIDALWQDMGLATRMRSLACLPAPMSIWPNQPGEDWSESFDALLDATLAAIAAKAPNVFVASCGAYGLPLVHAVHRRTRMACIHYGHGVNVYFGVRTNAATASSFHRRKPDSPHWLDGKLDAAFPAVARIDGGRYVSPAGGR